MSIKPGKEIKKLDPWKVKVMIHRARDEDRFELIGESIGEREQFMPGQVRDIRKWEEERRVEVDPGGTRRVCDWGLITGEGRLLIARKLNRPFYATVQDGENTTKVLAAFWTENGNRKSLTWAENAHLIRPMIDAGESMEKIAKRLQVGVKHVQKMHRILQKTAPELDAEIVRLPINDAEVLTTLKPKEQRIVLDAVQEFGSREIEAFVKRAKKVKKETKTDLTAEGFRKSMQRVNEELKFARDMVKVSNRNAGLSFDNLAFIRKEDPDIWREIKATGVNLSKFEALL